MSTIHGYATHAAGAQLLPFKYDVQELQPNEVEIAITHCGICHSDLHLIDNDWGLTQYPFIPGHEIVGTIAAMGSQVKDRSLGQRVAVGWQADSCG
ncbi:MAG: alcohol dehydrogenase catalytic domain-containing protein, partial [Acidobacteriaceae bacterium]